MADRHLIRSAYETNCWHAAGRRGEFCYHTLERGRT